MPELEISIDRIKINLTRCRGLWNYTIQGDTANGEIDLTFRNLMDAAAFVASNEIEEHARITFPDVTSRFNAPVTITIANYRERFNI